MPPQVNDINFNINARNVLVEEAGEHYAVVKFNGTEIGRQIFDIKVNKPVEKIKETIRMLDIVPSNTHQVVA